MFKFFPWERGEKPHFTNKEGFDWYIEKQLTDWAKRENATNQTKPLKAVCFLVAKDNKPVSFVLVGENKEILADQTSYENMSHQIDILRLIQSI